MPNKPLTKRQFQIWLQIAQGRSNKEIAARLGLTLPVVQTDARDLYRRLRVRNRTQAAVCYVFPQGLQ